MFQHQAYRADLDTAYNVVGEGKCQHGAGFVFADAARPQIKQRFLIELPDGCAVRTAHVIRKDFQLRLGVDSRVRRQQHRLIGLLGVGFLRILAHENFAVEYASRLAVQNAFVQFVAVAVRQGMVNRRVVIYQLLVFGMIHAIQRTFDAFAAQIGVEIIADDLPAKRNVVRREVRFARQGDVGCGDVVRAPKFLRDLDMVENGAFRRQIFP